MTNDKAIQKLVELKDVYDILNNIQNTLKESLKWTKFAGIKEVKPILESHLDSDTKKAIYSLSDGVNSSYEITRIIGTNDTVRRAISDYWDDWEKAGLGESKPAQGGGNRFKRAFSLEDFGIKVPEIQKQGVKKTVTEPVPPTEQPKGEVE